MLDDVVVVDELFFILMGEDVDVWCSFIICNVKDVWFLDV